jgi:hypothetical protein
MVQPSARPLRAANRPPRDSFVRRLIVLAAMAMVLGGARPASAQPAPMELIWHAPAGCPTTAQVEAGLKKNLAGSGARLVPFVAVVGVRGPTEGRWQASVLFQAGSTREERRFEAESCEAIASAATFIIALWAQGGAGAPSRPAVAPGTPNDPEIPRIKPDIEPPHDPRFALMLSGLLDWRSMPDPPAGGMEAEGGPIWTTPGRRLRLLAGLTFFPSRRSELMAYVWQADFQLFELSGRGCLTATSGRFEIGPCAGVALSVMHGFGVPLVDSTQQWLSLLGSIIASWKVFPEVALFARADLVVPTARKTFDQANYSGFVVYQVPAVAGRGALGIELRF